MKMFPYLLGERRVVSLQCGGDGVIEPGELVVDRETGSLKRRAAAGAEDGADYFADVANELRFFPALGLQELLVPAPAPPFRTARLPSEACRPSPRQPARKGRLGARRAVRRADGHNRG